MSAVAEFELTCCQKRIIFGRHCGDDMYPPTLEFCPNGCAVTFLPSGRKERKHLKFIGYHEQSKFGFDDRQLALGIAFMSEDRQSIERIWMPTIPPKASKK